MRKTTAPGGRAALPAPAREATAEGAAEAAGAVDGTSIEEKDGVLIFRPESGLVFFNVDHVCDTILERVGAEPRPPKAEVLDLSAAPRGTSKARSARSILQLS